MYLDKPTEAVEHHEDKEERVGGVRVPERAVRTTPREPRRKHIDEEQLDGHQYSGHTCTRNGLMGTPVTTEQGTV